MNLHPYRPSSLSLGGTCCSCCLWLWVDLRNIFLALFMPFDGFLKYFLFWPCKLSSFSIRLKNAATFIVLCFKYDEKGCTHINIRAVNIWQTWTSLSSMKNSQGFYLIIIYRNYQHQFPNAPKHNYVTQRRSDNKIWQENITSIKCKSKKQCLRDLRCHYW